MGVMTTRQQVPNTEAMIVTRPGKGLKGKMPASEPVSIEPQVVSK